MGARLVSSIKESPSALPVLPHLMSCQALFVVTRLLAISRMEEGAVLWVVYLVRLKVAYSAHQHLTLFVLFVIQQMVLH